MALLEENPIKNNKDTISFLIAKIEVINNKINALMEEMLNV